MSYKYDLHCHTATVSKCSRLTKEQFIEVYKSNGYDGAFITDHYLNGNAFKDNEKSLKQQIYDYAEGYREFKKYAENYNFDVFFGVEYSYKGTDVLFYGLPPEWYVDHPEILEMSMKESILFIKENGGLTVQAHPFRRAGYIDHVRLFAEYTDGIETFNACRLDIENDLADNLANVYGMIKTSASDMHSHTIKRLGGMEFDEKLKDEKHLVELLRQGKGRLLNVNNILSTENKQ